MLSTYILCPCKRNHRVSTTALNAYSGLKNTLIQHGIDVVEKLDGRKTNACARSELARGNDGTRGAGMLLHKYRCRDAVFFCTRVIVFWHYHRSKGHHKLNLEQLVQQAHVTGKIARIPRSQQELMGPTLRSNIFIHTLVKQGTCKKWLHTRIPKPLVLAASVHHVKASARRLQVMLTRSVSVHYSCSRLFCQAMCY